MKQNCTVTLTSSDRQCPGIIIEGQIRIGLVGDPPEEDLIVQGPKLFILMGRGCSGPYDLDDARFTIVKP